MSTRLAARIAAGLTVAAIFAGCAKKQESAPLIGSAVVGRQTIIVDAQATGVVEPINVIEVKSKASGMITSMPVEIGTEVRPGALLVQVDTRDVTNQYDQAVADLRSAEASLQVAESQKKRSDELYAARIITAQEFESAQLSLTQAQGSIIRATANVDLAKQRLEDATVVAPVAGTIIEKPVALGQVIASATGSVSGGTTLLKMADLTQVRVRTLVNETDIGAVRANQPATVTVDAYPDRPFRGRVEKVEPQAVVQQSVTMFPVIVALENREGLLKPGMNGEVSLLINQRDNVVSVPNDAVKTLREAQSAAALFGLNPDSVQASIREQQSRMGGGGGAFGAAETPADAPSRQQVPMDAPGGGGAGAAQPTTVVQAGDVAAQGGAARSGGTQTAGGNGRSGRGGGNGAARSGGNGGNSGAVPGTAVRARTALVFVQNEGIWEPRVVRLGVSNYDFSEVLSGLQEGETVALLAVASLQQRRDAQNDRMRSNMGGGVPGLQSGGGGGARGGGGGGGGGGRGGGM